MFVNKAYLFLRIKKSKGNSNLFSVLMHFSVNAQKTIFDDYIIAGANFTINNFNKGTTTYNVVNSPYTNEIKTGSDVSFGVNFFIGLKFS